MVLGGVLPPAAAAGPRGLLEQTRAALVPVYRLRVPGVSSRATMRDTVTAPGLSGEASGCGGVVDTTGGARGAQWVRDGRPPDGDPGSLGSWLIANRTLVVFNHTRVLRAIFAALS